MKKELWGFWFSENKNSYIRIAFKFHSTPWKVYNLAHGSRAKSHKESQILEELKKEGIIFKITPW